MNAPRIVVGIVLLVALAIPGEATASPSPGTDAKARTHDAAPDFDRPAVRLRIALGRALGEHAFLVIEAMRTGAEPGADYEAAAAVLDENTAEIEELVSGVLQPSDAEAFGEQWRNHVAYLIDYARAVEAGDEDAQQLAERQLETYADEFSGLLMDAFPSLPEHAVQELVGEHASQLQQVTDVAEGNYDAAYRAIRTTYAHMFTIGDALTIGILARSEVAPRSRAVALSPAVDLRVTLDRLFGEHTYLAAIVMRAHVAGDPHRNAAVQALEQNSAELADNVAGIYGAEAGAAFARLWARHTALYVRYVEATADGDAAMQDEALRGLESYRSDFSAFLADANPLLDRAGLERLLEAHTDHLVEQVEAYADGAYDHAYDMLRDAYAQTADLAAGLAGAIADQFPRQFPDTATTLAPGLRLTMPIVVGLACLVAAIALVVGRASGRHGPSRRRAPGWLPSWMWVTRTRSIR